ncbi:MAG: hypothetical protein ACJ8JD_02705, partial [Chthoniobacterales bacterium]
LDFFSAWYQRQAKWKKIQTPEPVKELLTRLTTLEAMMRQKESLSAESSEATPSTTTSSTQVEFSANDINQLIAANKKASGKAFVTIDKNVLHAQVAIPLKKLKFGDRQLIISGDVHASPDRDPHKLSITNLSLGGVDFPESVLNSMLRGRSMTSYVDEYAQKYQVTGFTIENNQVVLEGTPQAGQ